MCLLGFPTIAAIIDDNFDPYHQAIENIQREDLDPLDIADWIQKREEAGDSRTFIAQRLGKPKSWISEIALLIKAPAVIREAFRSRRIPDIRSAYLLARKYEEDPVGITRWLNGESPINRRIVYRALHPDTAKATPSARPQSGADTWNSFSVQVAGREGTMVLKPGDRANQATIRFADGSQEAVALSKIRLKTWVAL